MKFHLKDTDIIKQANVELNGLTVIAGENATGKTTVAKCLYNRLLKHVTKIPMQHPAIKKYFKENSSVSPEDIIKVYHKVYKLKYNKGENEIEQFVFIDSPNFLDTFSYMKNASLFFLQRRVNINMDEHRTDLVVLLSQEILEQYEYKEFYTEIEQIIDGKVYYDEKKDDIFYKQYSIDKTFDMKQTANGIKMFGYLQMLLLNGTIKSDSLLILDEPEVHLHPKWQLKYAEILTKLVKNGVKVLVNSHSPYMIQALIKYARDEKIVDESNFYLTNKSDNYVTIENKNEDLNKIFELLAEPMNEIFEL